MIIEYKNKYGSLKIETVSEKLLVRNIAGKNIPDELKFSMDEAEKITLISENDGVQCGYQSKDLVYLIYHVNGSYGHTCRILSLDFTSPVNPTEEIERLVKMTMRY